MERALVVGISLVLVVTLCYGPGVVATERAQPSFEDGSAFDAATYYVEVYANGSVRWTAKYQTILENESEVRTFESFAERFEHNETRLFATFKNQALTNRVGRAENVTGRPMEVTAFSRSVSIEEQAQEGQNATLGVVGMSFVWTNATVQENGRIVLGDVFEGGLYLAEGQSLVVMAGPDLRFVSVSPMESAVLSNSTLNGSESVTWTGEMQFADRRPRAVFERTAERSGMPADLTWMMIGLLVALLGVGATLLWRQVGTTSGSMSGEPDRTDTGEPAISDEELLSDEARVEQMLAENGDRMKQVDIVEATGWSKAKVSTLLSEMAEEGTISKLRIGRENIITLEREESVVDSSTDEGSS